MAHEIFEHIEQLDQALGHLTRQAPGLPIGGLKSVVDKIRSAAVELAGETPDEVEPESVPEDVVAKIAAEDAANAEVGENPDPPVEPDVVEPGPAVAHPNVAEGDPKVDAPKGRRR